MSDQVTDAELTEYEAQAGAATEGPWESSGPRNGNGVRNTCGTRVIRGCNEAGLTESDAAFIAASREAVPRLVKALREARALLAEASTHLRVVAHNVGVEIERGAHQWDGVNSLLSEKAARIDAALGGES